MLFEVCRRNSGRLWRGQEWILMRRCTPCVIPLPRTCWKTVQICGISGNYSVMLRVRLRKFKHM